LKNKTNQALKIKMLSAGVTYEGVATDMGINAQVFKNKINRKKVNGYTAYFKPVEKSWLADKFCIDESEIE
jgi:DNA invertase Pin-like site-specific DNA recombinase